MAYALGICPGCLRAQGLRGWLVPSLGRGPLVQQTPTERVIELGCGPGVAVAALADRATRGLVVGVDQSEVVIGQARRRNADAIRQGRVRLIHAPVERLQVTDGPFDAALAVNTVGMWPDLATRLREIGQRLRPGGRIALVSQPRCPGATAATSAAAADRLTLQLSDAGFTVVRVGNARPRSAGSVRARHSASRRVTRSRGWLVLSVRNRTPRAALSVSPGTEIGPRRRCSSPERTRARTPIVTPRRSSL